MIQRPDIDALLAGPLGGWLKEQTNVRDAAREASASRLIMSAFIVLPFAAFLWFGPNWGFEVKAFLTVCAGIGASVWIYAPRAKAIAETKHGINDALAKALGLEYQAKLDTSTGFEFAKSFGLVPSYDRHTLEDLWTGTMSDRPFSLHEADLEEERKNGNSTHYVTVFRGAIMAFGYARAFSGTTLVTRAGKYRKFGFFSEKDQISLGGLTLARAQMVSPQMEEEFSIYSTDQVEARYLVHPVYVERLIALEDAFSGQKIRALFHNGELIVALETENMFESGSLDASRDREMIETCIGQFMTMADLADSLNEPERT